MIRKVEFIDELLHEFEGEGLVCLGCGGDLNEWVDGVNNIMLSQGVTSHPKILGDAIQFEYEGLTNLLFPFPTDSDDFNVSRLAIVRLHYDWMKWWSDYKDNTLLTETYEDDEDIFDDFYYDEYDEDCPLFTPDDDEGCPVCGSVDVIYKPGPSHHVSICNNCGFVDCEFDESEVQ